MTPPPHSPPPPGEAWQDIMLDCVTGQCDPHSDHDFEKDPDAICGTVFAIPYFVSFYVLCSFLVSGESSREGGLLLW